MDNHEGRAEILGFRYRRFFLSSGLIPTDSQAKWRVGNSDSGTRGCDLVSSVTRGSESIGNRTRIALVSGKLRNVPAGFRLMPGMKVRAEIEVGRFSVISQLRGDYIQTPAVTETSVYPRYTATSTAKSTTRTSSDSDSESTQGTFTTTGSNDGSSTSTTSETSSTDTLLPSPTSKRTQQERWR